MRMRNTEVVERLCRVGVVAATLASFLLLLLARQSEGQVAPEEFFQRDFVDAYDEIRQKMESVTEENCGIKVIRPTAARVYGSGSCDRDSVKTASF